MCEDKDKLISGPMSDKRLLELESDLGKSLTKDEIEQGYHFCIYWNGMLIYKDDHESEKCRCYFSK